MCERLHYKTLKTLFRNVFSLPPQHKLGSVMYRNIRLSFGSYIPVTATIPFVKLKQITEHKQDGDLFLKQLSFMFNLI